METIIISDRELPVYRPGGVVVGCDYRDALHLQALTEASDTPADLSVASATWALSVSDEQAGTVQLTGGTIATWADSGVLVEEAATGYVHLVICAADTTLLGVGTYYYQLTVTLPAGHTVRPSWTQCLLAGTLTITAAAAA